MTLDLTTILILLLVAFAPPALFALSVARAKRYRREPGHALRKAFFWGALGAAGIALILNTYLSGTVARPYLQHEGQRQLLLALVIAPIVEESAKVLGIILIASVRRHTDEVVDGIIYGAVIGLGFSATENLFYEFAALATGGQQLFILTALARTFSSSLLHATASAVAGYGMARWFSGKSRFGFFAAVPWYILAVLMHSAFNAIAFAAVWITIFPLILLGLFAFGKVKKRITELSLIAPTKKWKPVGHKRSFGGDDEGTIEPGVWVPVPDEREEDPAVRWDPVDEKER